MDFVRLTAEQRRAMDEDGYLVVPGALDERPLLAHERRSTG